ncbi:Levanase precursor [Gemmata obscuriglobus]|uniref:2,6-beta-D-fructofuranosidase n=1 Tax=Gemmata obscuriglobus TaxID=114 RepID=A0A2Z3H463_9BACT|nr:GH32 C-terminal domain-containing protein [Gemmata obscuriglobus]AWM40793.1 2,6-beta-D-fructofuranosidase [Gemmata obscuriglobus]QEG25925.1 Levanase precursor [Gemmata obscuriglobus]VTS00055.1 glycosyl hydrolase family 32 : Beta-fructosidase, levanase/invertase OS=Singulisphaera acidiphila (strain ATCC BAA-1392 / DSM 18658 / VKM B-2454 / MOB10) GN=Sinac_4623 PE=4 SV=1: Glyco_hydro_32N [Gemmata obscuriglobus UQM 2246]
MRFPLSLLICAALAPPLGAEDRKDVLVADFEGSTYGAGWKTTGTAFGPGPAAGTLPGQMSVSGFLGKGLVNSFLNGDDSTGTLTSPELTIDRKYLNFLVGGGKHPGKTCINLLVGGKVARTATGPNDRPGGSEHLDWHSWDVTEFAGQKAVIEIVDQQKGGWGHINVDHIVLSDTKKQNELLTATLDLTQPYLLLPVKNGAPVRRVRFLVGGAVVREFDIELATDGKGDFRATSDVSAFKGKKLTVEALLPADVKLAGLVDQSPRWADADKIYKEMHRPLFHFTSRTGWLNDPNGLVYADGAWHLFYQHNPFGREWGNMHWGHAVSADLFRWKEEGIALYPRKYGDWAFSGSAVVDKDNTSGWGTKEKPPLVLAYTSTGRGECMASSTDGGRTWTEYDKNPVVKHAGRDPKLIWHEPTKNWVMAVYDEAEKKQWIAFYTSPDLKAWTFASRIEGFFECPDLFQQVVSGKGPRDARSRWVLYGADGKYLLGDFDGKQFKPDFKEKKQLWYGRFYAAQTFDSAPARKGNSPRRVQIGWAQGVSFPGTPFNQQMTVPVELRLLTTPDGPRLAAMPVDELRSLRETAEPVARFKDTDAKEPTVLAENLDAFEVICTASAGRPFVLDLRGTKLSYDPDKNVLTCNGVTAPVDAPAGAFLLHVLVDRGSVEVFADNGRVAMSVAAIPNENNRTVGLGGRLDSGAVWRLKSAWEK